MSIACLRVGDDPSLSLGELIDTQLYSQGYILKSAADCGVFISQARGCASQLYMWKSCALMIDGRHVRLRLQTPERPDLAPISRLIHTNPDTSTTRREGTGFGEFRDGFKDCDTIFDVNADKKCWHPINEYVNHCNGQKSGVGRADVPISPNYIYDPYEMHLG